MHDSTQQGETLDYKFFTVKLTNQAARGESVLKLFTLASNLLLWVFVYFLSLDQKDLGHGWPESHCLVQPDGGQGKTDLGQDQLLPPTSSIFTGLPSIIAPVGPSAGHSLYRGGF